VFLKLEESQILHRQTRELDFNMFNYFKRQAKNAGPMQYVAKSQERTADF
jgi:hypothetical protein